MEYVVRNAKKAVDEYDRFVSNDDFVSESEKRQVFLYGQRIMLEREFELGEEQGAHADKLEVAKVLLLEGLDISTIVKLTGLTKQETLTLENKSI